jgi:NADP-dependent 3-hydroxy acid dehydrogenase YdfG
LWRTLLIQWSCVRLRINNAGSNGYKYKTLAESTDADLVSIVETNVLGVMLGCKEVSIYLFGHVIL